MATFSLVWSQLDTGSWGLVKEGASCVFGDASSDVVAEGELVEGWIGAGARAGAQEKC